jgi:hypothetical protein
MNGKETLDFVRQTVINRGGKFHGFTGSDGKLSITLQGIRYRLSMDETVNLCKRLPSFFAEKMQRKRKLYA